VSRTVLRGAAPNQKTYFGSNAILARHPLFVFSPLVYPEASGGKRYSAKGHCSLSPRFQAINWLISSGDGVAVLLLDLLLGLGIEVGYVKHPANFDHFVVRAGDARGPIRAPLRATSPG